MTLRLTAALTADLRGLLAAEVAAGERAARGAVTDTGRWTQEQLRGQVRSGFGARSARLANTWRLAVYTTSAPTLRRRCCATRPCRSACRGREQSF